MSPMTIKRMTLYIHVASVLYMIEILSESYHHTIMTMTTSSTTFKLHPISTVHGDALLLEEFIEVKIEGNCYWGYNNYYCVTM